MNSMALPPKLITFAAMFARLKDKWKVGWFQFVLIFTTFALGGSLCARAGSWLLQLILDEKNWVYWVLYVPLITILWPMCVLLVSIPLGQFRFFTGYLKKMGVKMGLVKTSQQSLNKEELPEQKP
jgi:hypothetical protein